MTEADLHLVVEGSQPAEHTDSDTQNTMLPPPSAYHRQSRFTSKHAAHLNSNYESFMNSNHLERQKLDSLKFLRVNRAAVATSIVLHESANWSINNDAPESRMWDLLCGLPSI